MRLSQLAFHPKNIMLRRGPVWPVFRIRFSQAFRLAYESATVVYKSTNRQAFHIFFLRGNNSCADYA